MACRTTAQAAYLARVEGEVEQDGGHEAMNDLPESMKEDPLGACRGMLNGCLLTLGCVGFFLLVAIVVLIVMYPGF